MVWDGMRPDLVSPELTPNLARLASQGTTVENSHAIVPTVTRCNAATMATGALPLVHGLPANVFFAPKVDAFAPISVGEGDNVRRLQEAYGVFDAPTISDIVGVAGGRTVIVSSGTRGCAQMLHPRLRERGDVIVHPTLSSNAELAAVDGRLGPLPEIGVPDTGRNLWLTRAAAETIVPEQRPDVLIFWHDDPDQSQHHWGFGHPRALEGIRDADWHLGMLLDALDGAGLREETIVAVTSDHGYVHVRERVNLPSALARVGDATGVTIAQNGCAALVYVDDPSDRAVARVARQIETIPGVDVVFSGGRGRPVVDGTVPLDTVGGGGPLAPDLLVTATWSDDLNLHNEPGVSHEFGPTNLATHGGASRWELRNTLVLAGPGIRRGVRSSVPAGNIDLAPTLLHCLGLPAAPTMTGRVLAEALDGHDTPAAPDAEPVVERVMTPRGTACLRWSTGGGRRYLDAAWSEPAEAWLTA
jgi:arylsulfatase A-like enzyme